MKKLFKNNIFGFIIGGLIFGVIGVGATTLYNATQISYNDSNVKTALDELYDMNNSSLGKEMNLQITLVPSPSDTNNVYLTGNKGAHTSNVSIENMGFTKMDCYYYDVYFPMYLKLDGTLYSMTANETTTFDITGKNEILFYVNKSNQAGYTNRVRVQVRLYN